MATLDLLDELFGPEVPSKAGVSTSARGADDGAASKSHTRQNSRGSSHGVSNTSRIFVSPPRSTPPTVGGAAAAPGGVGDAAEADMVDDSTLSTIRTGRLHEASAMLAKPDHLRAATRHRAALEKQRTDDDRLEQAVASRDAMRAGERRAALTGALASFAADFPHVTLAPYLDAERAGPRTRMLKRLLASLEQTGLNAAGMAALRAAARQTDDWVGTHARTPQETLLVAALTTATRNLATFCTCQVVPEVRQVGRTPPVALEGEGAAVRLGVANWAALVAADPGRAERWASEQTALLAVAKATNAVQQSVDVKASCSLVVGEAHALFDAVLSGAKTGSPAGIAAESARQLLRESMKAAAHAAAASSASAPAATELRCRLTGLLLQGADKQRADFGITWDARTGETGPLSTSAQQYTPSAAVVSRAAFTLWRRCVRAAGDEEGASAPLPPIEALAAAGV